MQKQRVVRAVAALAMGAAVAAALVWAGVNEDNTPSLSYNELLALAGDETAASSALQELEASLIRDETVDNDPAAVSELETVLQEVEDKLEEAASASSEEVVTSENAAASEGPASSSPEPKPESTAASSAASSAAASHVAESAASSHPTASEAASAPSASSTKTADELCDEKLADYIRQIERLQKNSEKKLYQIIQAAYDDYMTHPVEERNLMLKVSVVLSKSGQLTSAQSECDTEFNRIVAEMRQTLRENGRDETLADEAVKTYKQKKSAMIKELTDQAYSGADGKGQSAKWLEEHIDELG